MGYYRSLEKRIRFLERYFIESKKDQEVLNDFLGDDYYNKYMVIKNKISDPEYKDIYRLIKKNPSEVKDYIDNFKSGMDIRSSSKDRGAIKLYEDSDWVVYHITNHSAAKYYGRDTKWCISGNYAGLENEGEMHFNRYNYKSNIYFYINKNNPREKYAVLKKRSDDKIVSIYNSKDVDLGNSLYYAEIELPYVEEIGLVTAEQEDLFFAVREGDLDMVKELANQYTVNTKDSRGNTPLILVAGFGYEDIAEYLIKKGAKINVENNSGCTPLMRACEDSRIEIVKLLVKYGADINAKTKYGSALNCSNDDAIDEFLIQNGATE